jgi:simple sugar transport system permease protein
MVTSTKSKFDFGSIIRRPEFGAFIGLLFVYLFFAIFGGEPFTAVGGFASWMNIAAELGIIALPVGLLMIAGDLDLSVGSTLAAGGITAAVLSGFYSLPTWIGIFAGLAFGTLIGFVNGIIIVRTNLPSFVVTLATNFSVFGLILGTCKLLTGTVAVSMKPDPVSKSILGTLLWGQFETAIFLWAGVAVIVSWVLYKSPWGNWIYAIGGDATSARLTGIPVDKVRVILFVCSGFAASLVGVMQTVLYESAQVNAGQSFVFNSIIAVVIGGVSLTGGYGSTVGVILGAMTFAIVNQGIYYTGWESDWASLILGVLLLIAVLTNNTFRRLAIAGRKKKKVHVNDK